MEKYLGLLAQNARNVFFDGKGVSAVALVLDSTLQNPASSNFRHDPMSGYLVDPYEGEMFVFFLCLFGNVTKQECDQIWLSKRPMLRSIEYQGTTIQKGWWFSSHENWKVSYEGFKECDSLAYFFLFSSISSSHILMSPSTGSCL